MPVDLGRDRSEDTAGVVGHDDRDVRCHLRQLCQAGVVGEDRNGAGGHGIGDEAGSVHVEAGQGGIHVAGDHGTAVERHAGDQQVTGVGPCRAHGRSGPDPGRQVAKEHAGRGGSKGGR